MAQKADGIGMQGFEIEVRAQDAPVAYHGQSIAIAPGLEHGHPIDERDNLQGHSAASRLALSGVSPAGSLLKCSLEPEKWIFEKWRLMK
jgi:hypothetical protein